MKRVIVTVVGKDTVGIIARLCTYMAEHNVNILDISQTILQGIFTMTMLVDLAAASAPFLEIKERLDALADELGVQITMQREEVFKYMYRL